MTPTLSRPRYLARMIPILFVSLSLAAALPGQAPSGKKPLGIEDYTRWRSISGASISSDGKWVTYGLSQMNTSPADAKPVLHLVRLADEQDTQVANGTGGAFSPDGRWLAYVVDPNPGGRGGRGGRGGAANESSQNGRANRPAQPRRVELRNLETGAIQSWQDIQSFSFSPSSSHLLLRRRAPNAANANGGRVGAAAPTSAPGPSPDAAEPKGPRGVDVILHDLATGHDQLLGSVGDIAFNKRGDLLAYTVDAAPRDGNGLFLVDLKTGRVNPLDNDARVYSRLEWNDAGTALAVLKGVDVDKMRERDNILLAYPDVQAAMASAEAVGVELDPAKTSSFPKGFVVSDRAALDWSADGKRVFFGIREQGPAPDTTTRRRGEEVADVDVWNTKDDRIQSVQMVRADADRNFTYREAFDVSAGGFVRLADSTMRDLDISQDGRWGVGRDTRAYTSDYHEPAADIYRVNTTTGERTLIARDQLIGPHTLGISPDGNTFLYWKDGKFQAYHLNDATTTTLATGGDVSFTNMEFDHPGVKPSYGINGFTADGKAVVAATRYDLYLVPLDGSAPTNLTKGEGAKNQMRFRYAQIEPDTSQPSSGGAGFGGGRGGRGRAVKIDLSKPVTLSAYGEWTKKEGFYRLDNGALRQLVYDDASFTTPTKAAKADVYLFTRQTFTEYPDLRVSSAEFTNTKRISDANPQQSEYLWGHRMLVDFKDHDGHRLQALLTLPDDYKPGEKRPMLVNFYEKNSQNLHHYVAPSFLTSMGSMPMQATSDGYVTLIPDVYFHTGRSHSDMLDAVESAVKKVIAMGYVDPKHIGINGHSFGGEGAAFIGTRSRLFAAVGVGAGVSDLYQDFNQNWGWSYQIPGGNGGGNNGSAYYIYDQGRWGFSPWDKPDVYMFESALTHVREVTAPFLIMHGTADPTVAFQNGLGLYNALRFNGKDAILLAYIGEGHGLRGLGNRKDLTIRYFEFFDHYLKGTPAPTWMTKGVPYLQKEAALHSATGIVP